MQHLIKAISITLGLAFCASPVMAQFPKIPKVKVPKVDLGKGGKGGKDPVKTVTGNTGNNSASKTTKSGNLEEYEAAMKQGGELSSARKYVEAAASFEKAVNVAPESPTQPYKQRAESRLSQARKDEAKCKENQTKMNDWLAAGNYVEIGKILNEFCDVKVESNSTCDCLIPKAEIDKFQKAVDGGNNRKTQLIKELYSSYTAYTRAMGSISQSRDALTRLNVVEELATAVEAANYKQLKDEAIKYGLESDYNRADKEYQNIVVFFSDEDKFLRQELDGAYANLKSAKPTTGWLLEKFTILARYCDIALAIDPNNKLYKDSKAEALKYKEMTLQKMRDSGVFSSKFHEENVYKVLFSDKPFIAGKESQNTIKTKFSLNDKIYGIAYFDERKSEPVQLSFDLGSDKYIRTQTHRQTGGGEGYYAFEVIPDIATGWTNVGLDMTKGLAALTPRNYDIKVQLGKAVGALQLDATTGQEHVEKVNKAIYEKRVDMNRMQKPVSTDATAIDQATKLLSSAAGADQKLQVQRVVVLNKNWTTYFDPNYIVKTISHRAIDVEIGYKDLKTGKCYCHDTVITQNHNGKAFTNYEMSVRPNMDNEIRCENINK